MLVAVRVRVIVRVRVRVRVRCFVVTRGHKWVLCVGQRCGRRRWRSCIRTVAGREAVRLSGLGPGLDIDFREIEVSGNRTQEPHILAKRLVR